MYTNELSYIPAASCPSKGIGMTPSDVMDSGEGIFNLLNQIGVGISRNDVAKMMSNMQAAGVAMDSVQGSITTATIPNLIQFLQNWLPGFVNVLTAARKIDELTGIVTAGQWHDEEVVQGILEPMGQAQPYGDYTNVPFSNWDVNFERRSIVRFEMGMQVGRLEEARASTIRVNSAESKRASAALQLDIRRNDVGFNGYNSGANRTYGFLNDPGLPNYTSNPGPAWSSATFLEITGDIRAAFAALQNNTKDVINPAEVPTTLAVATAVAQYLSVTNTLGTQSVLQWLNATYPLCRVVSAPQLNAANGGQNVFYLYADSVPNSGSDDERTWVQVVPAKFQMLGVAQQVKSYQEDYTNATAGVMCKRPYAVVRYTDI